MRSYGSTMLSTRQESSVYQMNVTASSRNLRDSASTRFERVLYVVKSFGMNLNENGTLTEAEVKQKISMNVQIPVEIDKCGNNDGGRKIVKYRMYGRNRGNGGMYRQRNNYGKGSSNRGGFGGRGRGVKKNRVFGPTNANDYNGSGKGRSKVDEGRSSRDSFAEIKMASEKINIDERGVGSKNIFSALSNEVEIEKRLEWESMKERIDEACKKGLCISIEEKEAWSEEKLGSYKISIGAEDYDNMVSQIGIGNNKDMNDEVAKDRSGIAQFLTQDVEWVSNTTDSCKGCRIVVGWDSLVVSAKLMAQTKQVMHLLIKSLLDDNQMYVSVIYCENTPKFMARL
nr:hypothetical protein [Tanacetum cinerariifolium]